MQRSTKVFDEGLKAIRTPILTYNCIDEKFKPHCKPSISEPFCTIIFFRIVFPKLNFLRKLSNIPFQRKITRSNVIIFIIKTVWRVCKMFPLCRTRTFFNKRTRSWILCKDSREVSSQFHVDWNFIVLCFLTCKLEHFKPNFMNLVPGIWDIVYLI